MVSSDIWMGSGATVSMIPEQEINLGTFVSITTSNNQSEITLNATFTTSFSLVTNLYRGCYLNIYAVSGNTFTERVLIQSNTATTITVNALATSITPITAYYGVIEQYGAPVPAPKGANGSDTYTAQVLSVQFKSDTAADYEDVAIIFGTLDAESGSPTENDVGIFLTTDGTYGDAASLTGETEVDITVNIGNAQLTTAEEYIDAVIHQINLTSGIDFSATRDGDKLIITNTYGGTISRTPGTDDGGADSTISSLDAASTSTIELSVTTAGATVSASGANPRLLSDTWLGLVSSVTIPSTNVTTEQMNLVAGGTRNFIYQYKGIEETSGGSLDMLANSFWPLYYALGRKRLTSTNTTSVTGANLTQFAVTQGGLTASSGTNFIFDNDGSADTDTDTIRRVEGTTICPPLANSDDTSTDAAFHLLNRTNVGDHITYTITEENGHTLPSFALEYTLKKADQNATVAVDSAKENVYTKIYPGTVINSLTMNADVAGPVNMNLSLAHKNTFVAPINYETLNNATDVKEFINYRGRLGQTETLDLDTDADTEALMRPFFFADGTISLFGQDYIRLASFNLTIDNQLQAQRYIGRYDKNSQTQLTGQRTYTLSFTGHVTDAAVFTELQNQLTTALSVDDASEIVLRFTKENGEELELKFGDYMVTSAEFPVGNDRGPVVVNWTIQPLSMRGCTHTTYWAIQG